MQLNAIGDEKKLDNFFLTIYNGQLRKG